MQIVQASCRLAVGAALGALLVAPPGAYGGGTGEFCEGLTGVQFGLCNAYCNAQNCPQNPQPSCEVLRRNWERQTGSSMFPCDGVTQTPTQGVDTATPTVTFTPTGIPTGTATATAVGTFTPVATGTPLLTATPIVTATVPATATIPATATAIPTGTAQATPTGIPTGTVAATATPTGVPTGTAAMTVTPTGVPTGTTNAAIACVGDCSGDYIVTIDDLMRGVSIVLGIMAPEDCPMMSQNGVTMTIHELIRGVINALEGCEDA